MPSIFISYRRSDSHADVGRIYDRLAAHFGKAAVFKDVDDIPPGVDFRDYLNRTLNQCAVLLVVIGPSWLTATDAQGRRRLDNPADWVRVEIEESLRRDDVLVVPLLVSHATLPQPDDLPTSLQDLAYRNYREARPDPDFHKDMGRLIDGLEPYFGRSPRSFRSALRSPAEPRSKTSSQRSASAPMTRHQFLRWAVPGSVGLLGVFGLRQLLNQSFSFQPSAGSAGDTRASGWGTNAAENGTSGWGTSQTAPHSPSGTSPWGTKDLPAWAGDFSDLEAMLAAERWQEADQETARIMFESVGLDPRNDFFSVDNIQTFPCDTLQALDELWVSASDNRFGFSVQRKIYVEACRGSTNEGSNEAAFGCFVEQVGWPSVWEREPQPSQVTYSTASPPGHLPWHFMCGLSYCDGSRNELELFAGLVAKLTSCDR
ncbi:GUN4 domain-containing protein [Nodosilinea sp. AN01ver1]|uniref:GUN4 domain-containing protein n=1 Tax=Nodosilinea sp. AN01ver1 TaxID=3423362 RepID=UPI003D31587B